jgi:hypothetical protein
MPLMMPSRWARWWQGQPAGRIVVIGGLSLLGALFLVDAWRGNGPLWSVPFFPGNDIDAAMNLWLLERNLTLLRDGQAMGRLDVLFTTGAFWPDTNTLAWTDNWLVATPLYGLLRQALPPSQAFAALIVACLAGNTLACYRLTRHGATHPLARIAAAGLASLSLAVVARMGHAQLLPAFAGILAVDALFDAAGTTPHAGRWPDARAGLAAAAWLQLQLALGFYLGAFFALACACTAAVLLVRQWNRSSDASGGGVWTPMSLPRLWPWLAANAVLLAVNGVIYRQYALYADQAGPRAWGEVSTMVPRAWSYGYSVFATVDRVSFPAPVQYANGLPGPVWEHSMFPGWAFAAALLMAARYWRRLRGREALVGLTFGCGCLMLLTLGTGPLTEVWSLWRVLYELVPGLSAIRAVARVGLVLSLLAAPVLAAGLEQWTVDRRGRVSVARWVAFGGLWLVSGLSVPDEHRVSTIDYERRRTEAAGRIAEAVRGRGCVAFYVPTYPDTPEVESWRWQLLAMWGSLAAQTPTVNGYSGHGAQGGWSASMDAPALDRYLEARGVLPDQRTRVCHIPPSEMMPR